ncbi:hypothetical protein M681_03490 [Neisseria gonorrhoeae SK12684]|nr:hypothetical protein M683_07300 [Neisseria gonorrhoeae SK14515]KLS17111.1 hypothetical protein M687_07250 [Neisseria gonorrhoeae SK17973]KLS18844.1 hypothetical protein M704_08515 [Neisseria gonorrhoeae SK29471]KLS97264.1 hypothetical protein M681_03490 [Neisseria gonorrhoeae SK12684]
MPAGKQGANTPGGTRHPARHTLPVETCRRKLQGLNRKEANDEYR